MESVKKAIDKQHRQNEASARETLQEEWFNDYYRSRTKVYKMNFVRGIFFGLGSAIGGTLVLAVVLWILSLFVDFPLIGNLLKELERTLSQPK